MGIARGASPKSASEESKGRMFKLNAGDVVILRAGTGHQRIAASKAFLR